MLSPGSIRSIFSRLHDRLAGALVDRQRDLDPDLLRVAASPATVTSNDELRRRGDGVQLSPGVSVWSPGCAFTETMFVPCRASCASPPIEAPRMRVQDELPSRLGRQLGVGDEVRLGHGHALDPVCVELRDGERRKRSSQTMSLASEPARLGCEQRRVAPRRSRTVAVCLNVSASPTSPLTRRPSESTRCTFSSRRRPGGSRFCGLVDVLLLLLRRCRGASTRSAAP